MANIFNAAEIADMGIEKEKKRRDFYGLVAKNFKDTEMNSLFSRLRDWEDEHIKKFTAIRNEIKDAEITESYQGEFEAYIRAMVDDKLYSEVSPEAFSKNIKKPIDAIRYGIGFEKDAILFFNELMQFMAAHNKDKIEKLVNEEKQHIIYLTDLKNKFEK